MVVRQEPGEAVSEEVRSAFIVYFSQTGNTEQVAEAVGRGLRGRGVKVKMARLLEADPQEAAECDVLGLGTPVFYYKEPILVRRFIGRLPVARRKPAFTFITHGGNPVNTLARMQKHLARRGYTVVNSFSCHGYDSYPMFLRVFRQWGAPTAEDLRDAEAFGERLPSECRWFREEPRFALPRYRFVGGKYFLFSLLFSGRRMKRFFPAQKVNESLCKQCGLCVRNCPARAIRLAPYPQVSDACIWCYLCERICPWQAFEVDWSGLRKRMHV